MHMMMEKVTMQIMRTEDYFRAMVILGNPNTNPFQGKCDVRVIQFGTLWVSLALEDQQIQTLAAHGIDVSSA